MPRYLDREADLDRGGRSDPGYQLELGTGSLIGLLCILAVLCGLFFAFGYTLGKHAVPASFTLGENASSPPLNGSQASVPKPNPATLAPAPPAAQGGAQPPNPADLSAAERNQTPATLQPATGSATSAGNSGSAAAPRPAAPTPPSAALTNSAPQSSHPPQVTVGGNFAVQVFAGNKEADAMNLAAALKARQYPVYVVRSQPGAPDQLYRVQVGPYATQQEANEMRARLAADGYSAIIKQ